MNELRELAELVMQAHEWGYRDPVEGGFVEDRLPFDLAAAVLELAKPVQMPALESDNPPPYISDKRDG